ncbi:hypothetical protein CDAR_253271 [Caerostris darwini]|uniref:Uncharacterized protein n=1 Tax=Caerostris darwini TaxID=1538125 RepID=A0AAV4RJG5_9ARAC|nr:hypothetical protein CDAR_253271 [Caerostris darwini]
MYQKGVFYEDQFMCEKFVLQPHSAYCVPSGTRYLIMTCQKTLFSLHVVAADAALPPELNLLSPTSTRKLNAVQMPINMYRVPEKSKFKRLKTEAQQQQQPVSTDSQQQQQQPVSTDSQQQQQQPVSTDSQQQQQQPLSYLVSNETNEFLQVSGEIEEIIGSFSRPRIIYLQIPDMEVYRNIMQPNELKYFKDKFNKINQEYHLAMNELSIYAS